jgi:hypothetical protein
MNKFDDVVSLWLFALDTCLIKNCEIGKHLQNITIFGYLYASELNNYLFKTGIWCSWCFLLDHIAKFRYVGFQYGHSFKVEH